MALGDHVREFRARLLRALLVVLLGLVVALFFYDVLLDLVLDPYNQARRALPASVQTKGVVQGVTASLVLQLKLCTVASIVVTSPYWLAQIWGFIVPGLHQREKRWSRIFVTVAGPLFVLGVATGYYVLPRGLEVLLSFTPEGLQSLVDFSEYLTFFTRMMLIFGIAFEIPLFVIMLNLAGVVSGQAIGRYRPWLILGTCVFAAVATPSTDPFTMLALVLPMLLLFVLAEGMARVVDRVRARRVGGTDQWADDETSPL